MKYLKIQVESFRIKGDEDDGDQLQQDVYERLMAMIEAETLTFSIEEDEEEEFD